MNFKNRDYPQPILSDESSDFFDAKFSIDLQFASDNQKNCYVIATQLQELDPEFKDTVLQSSAVLGLHVDCSQSYYREFFKINLESDTLEISSSKLRGSVDVTPLIICNVDGFDYDFSSMHPDLKQFKFKLNRADIMAIGAGKTFVAQHDINPFMQIPSIFSIRANPTYTEKTMDLNLGDHKIEILLSENNYREFKNIHKQKSFQPIAATMIIVPALVSVLTQLKEINESEDKDFDDFIGKRWFTVLSNKLIEQGINLNKKESFFASPMTLALELLGDPLTETFENLKNLSMEG